MPQPEAVVDVVADVSTAASTTFGRHAPPAPVRVSFQHGRSGLLDVSSPQGAVWADVLDELRASNQPAYVQIDPETLLITELLVPIAMQVGKLTETGSGDVEVELVVSQAVHYLRRSTPDFQDLRERLAEAQRERTHVLVTETLDHDIIDVRPQPRALGPPNGAAVAEEGVSVRAAVSPTVANQMFTLVSGTSCPPTTAASPCIPFLYPDDGCWGRAHEMCRLMAAHVEPAKLWIYSSLAGSLRVVTVNNPACEVSWGWHVAPTLAVDVDSGTQTWVVDPSMFTSPVRQATWESAQGDPNALSVPTNWAVFHRTSSGEVTYDDTSYSGTRAVLETYRRQLRLRSVSPSGPPPYPQCGPPPYPPSTLHFADVAPWAVALGIS